MERELSFSALTRGISALWDGLRRPQSWLATAWSGVCVRLLSISKPDLVITGIAEGLPDADSSYCGKNPGTRLVLIKGAGNDLMF